MRNLKRALSLTLASVMLLGMMVIGTSAASFTDADQITNETAATILQDLEIMQGSNGKFNPNSTVTRGQMAIIICKMLYGKNLNVNQFAGSQQFDDVPAGQYYTGYVNLAASLGIISGYGNGKFGPGATVTTAQAALMLCRALGYFQAGELDGKGWGENALTAITQATKLGLFGELKLDTNAPLSRDNVAEMAFNSLTKVTPVQYNETWKMYYTDSESMFTGVKFQYDETLGYRNYGLVYTVDEDDFQRPTTIWGYGQLSDAGNTPLNDDGSIDTVDFNAALLPQTNRITEVANKPTASYDGKVTRATMYNLVGRSAVAKLEATSGTVANGSVDWHVFVDGTEQTLAKGTVFNQNDTTSIGRVSAAADDLTGNGVKTDVYIDSNGEVTIVIVNTYVLQATNDYSERSQTVTTTQVTGQVGTYAKTSVNGVNTATGELTLSSEDFNVSGVKMDDYLLVTMAGSAKTGKIIKTVEPANIITGKVDRFSNNNITIDGTLRPYAFAANSDAAHGSGVTFAIGEDTIVVADKDGNVLLVDEVTVAAGRYVYIAQIKQDTTRFDNTYYGDAYFLDGTHKTIQLKDKYKDNSSVSAASPATWFRYTSNSDEVYTLETLGTTPSTENHTNSATSAAGGKITENGKIAVGSYSANDNTIFVVYDKDKNTKAYTGIKNVPTIEAAAGQTLTAKVVWGVNGTFVKYAFINASTNATVKGAATKDLVFLLSVDETGTDNAEDDYTRWNAIIEGVEKKIDVSDDAGGKVNGLYSNIQYNDKGYITGMDAVTDADNFVKSNDSFTFSLDSVKVTCEAGVLGIGTDTYTVDNDTDAYLIARDTAIKNNPGAGYVVIGGGKLTPASMAGTIGNRTISGMFYVQTSDGNARSKATAVYLVVSDSVMDALSVEIADLSGTDGSKNVNDLPANKSYVTDDTVIDKLDDVWGGVATGDHVLITYDGRVASKEVTFKIGDGTVYTEKFTPGTAGRGSFLVSLDGKNAKPADTSKTGTWVATEQGDVETLAANKLGTSAVSGTTYTWTVEQATDSDPVVLASGSFVAP